MPLILKSVARTAQPEKGSGPKCHLRAVQGPQKCGWNVWK